MSHFLLFFFQHIVFGGLTLRFIANRVCQYYAVGIFYFVEGMLTALRTHKHQDVVVKHLECAACFVMSFLTIYFAKWNNSMQ